MSRTIYVVTDRGDLASECHGVFNLNFDGMDVLFAIATRPDLNRICVVEYASGNRWAIPLDYDLAQVTTDYPAIEADVIAKIKADAVLRGGDKVVAEAIRDKQKRFKTNEIDF